MTDDKNTPERTHTDARERTARRLRRLRSATAIAMIVIAFMCVFSGVIALSQWNELVSNMQIYYSILTAAGLLLLAAGAALLFMRAGTPVMIGGALISAVLAANQLVGFMKQSILCYTPT